MMWAIEIVADRKSQEPFPAAARMSGRVFERAFGDGLIVYVMSGCVDGLVGDHVMVAPPLIVDKEQLGEIVDKLCGAVDAAVGSRY